MYGGRTVTSVPWSLFGVAVGSLQTMVASEGVGLMFNRVVLPSQTGSTGTKTIVGVGMTVMVKEAAVPSQPLNVGVTRIVPLIDAVVAFVAVNEAILPVPLAGNPIAVLLFVQL